MFDIAKLIAIGVALAALYWAFEHYVIDPAEARGAANQLVADQKVVAKLQTKLDEATKQATDALADVQSCTAKVGTQTALVDNWKKAAKINADLAAKAKADGAASHKVAATVIERYQTIVNAPPVKDQSCQQKLDAVDKLLRDAARAKVAK